MASPTLNLAGVLGQHSTDKRIDILRRIGAGGSISEAARQAGVSYKAAWQAIETLSNLAGTPLVMKAVGGSGGGGAVLTDAGRQVLQAAGLLEQARSDVLARLEPGASGEARREGNPRLAAMALRTSMRNQFPCEVKRLSPTAGLVRVGLQLPGGGVLYSRITRDSAQLLQLTRGMSVLALCKATAVQVTAQLDDTDRATCNLLPGRVLRASRAAQGGEVSLQLDGGVSIVGLAAAGHRLKVDQPAVATIEESGVVIAMSG